MYVEYMNILTMKLEEESPPPSLIVSTTTSPKTVDACTPVASPKSIVTAFTYPEDTHLTSWYCMQWQRLDINSHQVQILITVFIAVMLN